MYRELLEQMNKIASEYGTEELETRASQVLDNLEALLKDAGYDDGIKAIVPTGDGYDSVDITDYMNHIENQGRINAAVPVAALGGGAVLAAVSAGKIAKAKKDSVKVGEAVGSKVKDIKKVFKTASTDEVSSYIDKFASSESYSEGVAILETLANILEPEELEIIASELLEKEAGPMRFMQGAKGAIQGAFQGAKNYFNAGKNLNMAVKGGYIAKNAPGVSTATGALKGTNYTITPEIRAGGTNRGTLRLDAIGDYANTKKTGLVGNVKSGFKGGQQEAVKQFDNTKQNINRQMFDASNGIQTQPQPAAQSQTKNTQAQPQTQNTQAQPQTAAQPQAQPQTAAQPQAQPQTQARSSKNTSQNTNQNPNNQQPQGFFQNVGGMITQHPYMATAAALGAGMMLPRVQAGFNAGMGAMQAPMVPMGYPPYPYQPYPYR